MRRGGKEARTRDPRNATRAPPQAHCTRAPHTVASNAHPTPLVSLPPPAGGTVRPPLVSLRGPGQSHPFFPPQRALGHRSPLRRGAGACCFVSVCVGAGAWVCGGCGGCCGGSSCVALPNRLPKGLRPAAPPPQARPPRDPPCALQPSQGPRSVPGTPAFCVSGPVHKLLSRACDACVRTWHRGHRIYTRAHEESPGRCSRAPRVRHRTGCSDGRRRGTSPTPCPP